MGTYKSVGPFLEGLRGSKIRISSRIPTKILEILQAKDDQTTAELMEATNLSLADFAEAIQNLQSSHLISVHKNGTRERVSLTPHGRELSAST